MFHINALGAYGIVPFLSEDLINQARLANIHTRAGKVAYLLSLGKEAKRPEIHDGIQEARGALKWIKEELEK